MQKPSNSPALPAALLALAVMAGAPPPANAQPTEPTLTGATDAMPDPGYFEELCLYPDLTEKERALVTARVQARLGAAIDMEPEVIVQWTLQSTETNLRHGIALINGHQAHTTKRLDETRDADPSDIEALLDLHNLVEQLRNDQRTIKRLGTYNSQTDAVTLIPTELSPQRLEQKKYREILRAIHRYSLGRTYVRSGQEVIVGQGECPDVFSLADFIKTNGHFPKRGEWTPESEEPNDDQPFPLTEEQMEAMEFPFTYDDLLRHSLGITDISPAGLTRKKAESIEEADSILTWLETKGRAIVATYAAYVANLPQAEQPTAER